MSHFNLESLFFRNLGKSINPSKRIFEPESKKIEVEEEKTTAWEPSLGSWTK